MFTVKNTLYAFLWVFYALFSIYFFPFYNVSVLILSVLIVAVSGRLYGIRGGLLSVLISMPFHYYVMDLYADTLEIYQAKFFGACIQTLVAIISGITKQLQDQVKDLSILLDHKVRERTHELEVLTTQLISEDEEFRVNMAQHIHDGLGQHLTGLLLYSSSLEADLNNKKSKETLRAKALTKSAETNLQLARKVSRTLFPIRISETGFDAAVDELTSYFTETTDIQFDIQLDTSHLHLINQSILQLYRLVYEALLNAQYYAHPSHISIQLFGNNNECFLRIEIDGCENHEAIVNSIEMELMHYRVLQVRGELTIKTSSEEKINFEFRIPNDDSIKNERMRTESHA
jgi:signal transduction histidine kinase